MSKVKVGLAACRLNSPSKHTIPNCIVSLSGSRYCIVIYNGVLGKATIQSHNHAAIDDQNLTFVDPPTTPLAHCLYLYTDFPVIHQWQAAPFRLLPSNHVKPITVSWCGTSDRTQGKPALPWSQTWPDGYTLSPCCRLTLFWANSYRQLV